MTEERDARSEPVVDDGAAPTPDDAADGPDEAALEAFDLDHDGRISVTEDVRAELGIADARAAELAEKPGLKGKIGRAAHRLLDKLDND
jgi:hypothetical protein